MMTGNGTYARLECNNLQHEGNNRTPKDFRTLSNNRTFAYGRDVSSNFSSAHVTAGQINKSSNGQHLAQTVSLSIDDIADIVDKPEIVDQAVVQRNDVMNEIEGDEYCERDPSPLAKHDFLVSFLVDARGGSMYGCRNSGIKV